MSSDLFLGSPFNIASYALLTYMIAEVCDLKPKELGINIGDAHIYVNHLEQVKEQLSRKPLKLPKLKFKRKVSDIDDFKYEDFELINYQSYPAIKGDVAI
jgi:thymidylate synthase